MQISAYKIQLILADVGMTQAKLAEKSGIARQNISNILQKGRCNPVTAGKIASGLGVHVSEITRGGE